MICQYCKKEIADKSEFCSGCGERLEKIRKPDFVLVGQSQNTSFRTKIKELDWFYWILIGVMTFSVVLNLLFDIRWVLYLLMVASVALFIYGLYKREKELTPEESEAESKAILYPFWKERMKREGKAIDPKEDEFYKRRHSEFNTKNTLTVILPLAVYTALRGELGTSSAMFVGLLVGGVIRLVYSFFENKDEDRKMK